MGRMRRRVNIKGKNVKKFKYKRICQRQGGKRERRKVLEIQGEM